MFKILVLSCLLAVARAAPADVVASKTTDSSVTVNKNDPYNPLDDTVVKKESVSQSVTKTDTPALPAGFDKTLASAFALYGLGYNPLLMNPYGYAPLYNPMLNPYLYNPALNPAYNPALYPKVAPYPAYPSYPSYPRPY